MSSTVNTPSNPSMAICERGRTSLVRRHQQPPTEAAAAEMQHGTHLPALKGHDLQCSPYRWSGTCAPSTLLEALSACLKFGAAIGCGRPLLAGVVLPNGYAAIRVHPLRTARGGHLSAGDQWQATIRFGYSTASHGRHSFSAHSHVASSTAGGLERRMKRYLKYERFGPHCVIQLISCCRRLMATTRMGRPSITRAENGVRELLDVEVAVGLSRPIARRVR